LLSESLEVLAAAVAAGGELSPWWRMGHNLNQKSSSHCALV
jgi:hypothetical protein